jgi:hypothetical protein
MVIGLKDARKKRGYKASSLMKKMNRPLPIFGGGTGKDTLADYIKLVRDCFQIPSVGALPCCNIQATVLNPFGRMRDCQGGIGASSSGTPWFTFFSKVRISMLDVLGLDTPAFLPTGCPLQQWHHSSQWLVFC